MKRLLSVMFVVLGSFVVAACGSDSGGSDAGASQTTKAAADVAFAGSPQDGLPVGVRKPRKQALTIGYAQPLAAEEVIATTGDAMKLETEALGGRYIEIDAGAVPDKQVSAIEQLIVQKVDAIVVLPLDAKALAPVLQKAKRAGIVVIGQEVDQTDPAPLDDYDTQLWMRRDEIAYLEAKKAASLLPAGAKVGQIRFAAPVPLIDYMVDRTKYWAEKFGLRVVGEAASPTEDIAGGQKAMTQLLSEHPTIQGVLDHNDTTATGAYAAARAAGKRDLVILGSGGGSVGYASVKDGKIAATVQYAVPDFARYSVWAAYDTVQGVDVPPVVLTGSPKVLDEETVATVPTWQETIAQRYKETSR